MKAVAYDTVITDIFCNAPNVKTFRLVFKEGRGDFDFIPGQFCSFAFMERVNDERSFSISSSPLVKDYTEITVKITGPFTARLLSTPVGTKLRMKGPYGNFIYQEDGPEELLMIAGGSGIAPFMSVIRYVAEKKLPNRITLLYSSRNREEIIFYDQLRELDSANENIRCLFTLTGEGPFPDWDGLRGRIDGDLARKYMDDIAHCRVYVCGPPGMVTGIRGHFKSLGFDRKRLRHERWLDY